MKLKNASFLDQHFEKLLIGGVTLLALIIGWFYVFGGFGGEPYEVTFEDQEPARPSATPGVRMAPRTTEVTRSPSEVPRYVADKARKLEHDLSPDKQPPFNVFVPDYTTDFRQHLREPLSSSTERFVWTEVPGIDPKRLSGPGTAIVQYQVPTPPAPIQLRARADNAVLAELDEPERMAECIQLIGDQKPRDFRYVSVSATFDLRAWKTRLRAPATPPAEKIPPEYWQPALFLTDVELRRETLDPNTGQWGEPEVVPPLPGQDSFRADPGDRTVAQAQELVITIKSRQTSIARSDFLPTSPDTGRSWLPPDLDRNKLKPEQNRRLHQILMYDLPRLDREIGVLRKRIESGAAAPAPALPIAVAPSPSPTGRPVAPLAPVAPATPSVRPTTPAPTPTARPGATATPGATPTARPAIDINQLLAQKEQERQALLLERDTLTGQVVIDPATGQPVPPEGVQPPEPRPGESPAEGADPEHHIVPLPDQVKVWAHDLTVNPGTTYRYSMVVRVLNPLYHRLQLDPAQKREYFNRLALDSVPSQAVEVHVPPVHQYFLTSASPDQSAATFKVFRVHNGVWRSTVASTRAGDPIGNRQSKIGIPGGGDITLDMAVGALFVDMLPGGPSGMRRVLQMVLPDSRLRERLFDARDPTLVVLENEENLYMTTSAARAAAVDPTGAGGAGASEEPEADVDPENVKKLIATALADKQKLSSFSLGPLTLDPANNQVRTKYVRLRGPHSNKWMCEVRGQAGADLILSCEMQDVGGTQVPRYFRWIEQPYVVRDPTGSVIIEPP